MRTHLRAAFEEVRAFLLSEGLTRLAVVGQNARGDVTKEFDLGAEERIVDYFRREVAAPVRILGEERGEVRTRPGPAEWTLIVDPVDGSVNFERGNELSAISLALLPGDGDPVPDEVSHALVGQIFTGTVCEAVRGEGAWRNGERVRPSTRTGLREAILTVDINFRRPDAWLRFGTLLQSVRDVRCFGSAATELAAVSFGGADAYVDARGTLSPENYIAAQLLVTAAGGVVSDDAGEPLAPVRSMRQGQSIVAAGNAVLHAAVLEALAHDPHP